MIAWEWEDLAYFFNPMTLEIVDAGPLLSPIQSFSVGRDEADQLLLETVSHEREHEGTGFPAGTVRTVTEVVTFESRPEHPLGYHAIASGVIPRDWKTEHQSSGLMETVQTSLIQSIEGTFRENEAAAYTIEWIGNIDQSGSIWTGASITTIETTSKRRTLKAAADKLELVSSGKSQSINNNGLKLVIDGEELYVCAVARPGEAKKHGKSGFIAYVGEVAEDRRQKIRDTLAFCLGNYLNYLGYVALNKDCIPIRVKALSARKLGSSTSQIPALPPAPLWIRYKNEIHQHVIGRMANAIFDKYDELNFAELSWAYWHAACAPIHMAAAHYGAAIEALRRACTESRRLRATLTPNGNWQPLKEQLLSCLSSVELDNTTRQIFINKISSLNQLPHDKAMDEVLVSMGLAIGALERSAWKRRNQAAHGSSLKETEITSTIRETKLLRILLHRMVLAATDASNRYIDYYTLGFPIRNLNEPVPDS